jgi:hypothetical protein
MKDLTCLHSFYSELFLMMFMKFNFVNSKSHLIIYAINIQLYQNLFSCSFITCRQAGRIDHHCRHSLYKYARKTDNALYMT